MGIATESTNRRVTISSSSMSQQDYHHQGIFSFSNGFSRNSQQQQQHVAQQIRRDKLRVPFDSTAPGLVGMGEEEEEEEEATGIPVYETVGMLSEMFNFQGGGGGGGGSTAAGTTATELLESQILQSYRNPRSDWFSQRQIPAVIGGDLGNSKNQSAVVNDDIHEQNQISSISADSAAAMQLFLMNPQDKSPSPAPPPPPPQNPTSSTLHILLPHPPSSTSQSPAAGVFPQFAWPASGATPSDLASAAGVGESQALSLSLSSHLEAAKAEELRMGGGEAGMLFFGQGGGGGGALRSIGALGGHHHPHHHLHGMATIGGGAVGPTSSYGAVNMLRNSKYAKAAQELLEEFCSVGRGQLKNTTAVPKSNAVVNNGNNNLQNQNPNSKDAAAAAPPLSAADRLEHQRRKVKLLSMLDEVERRYSHYCEQMQMVVNSFDMVMGFGTAAPYTSLAQRAMSRHFRSLKNAISTQLKVSCEVLGEKEAANSGITKGETPRLRILEQSLRQQRAFHQMGMMEQEAWRPQRGLPERSVNILRAWLFEHFLHPYPSDADKHLLARQTGLSKNQVSNWFINARVRLWKPMIEEMYQQESKVEGIDEQTPPEQQHRDGTGGGLMQTPMNVSPPPSSANVSDTSNNRLSGAVSGASSHSFPGNMYDSSTNQRAVDIESTVIRFGASGGDVSLTLGLRHAGNLAPEKSHFPVREFGGY